MNMNELAFRDRKNVAGMKPDLANPDWMGNKEPEWMTSAEAELTQKGKSIIKT